jgi:dynein heavy chain
MISSFKNGRLTSLKIVLCLPVKSPSSDLTWQKGAKRQMANLERFTEELLTFDDNQMPESTLQLVESYLKKPSFDADTLEHKTGNSACGSLARWVKGVARYHRMMLSKVKPLHTKVEQTTQAVDNAERKMSSLANKRKVDFSRFSLGSYT